MDPLIKLNFWLHRFENWGSVGKLLDFQTAQFLVFTETAETFVVSIIQFSFIKNLLFKKTAAWFCGCNIEDYFSAPPDFHMQLMLVKLNLDFQKTAVWMLIVLNCRKPLLERFVPTYQHFHVLSQHLWIRYFYGRIDSFENWKQCGWAFLHSDSASSIHSD